MTVMASDLLHDPGFKGLVAIALCLIGPCLGSFASAIAYRAPRGLSWISDKGKGARSACPHCGYELKLLDLIPIFSWLCLRGQCRSCHAPVSALYPALEIVAWILSLGLLFSLGVGAGLVIGLVALPFLLALNVIAWHGEALPKQLLFILLGLGFILMVTSLVLTQGHLPQFLIGAGLGAGAFAAIGVLSHALRVKLLKRQGDLGVIGFLAVAGLWLGLPMLPVFLILAGICGLALALLRWVLKRPQVYIMPNAYTAAFLLILVFGQQIIALLIP